MRERFATPERFFRDHFVGNYCPLAFFDEEGRNRTPDKLRKAERGALFGVCDRHAADLAALLGCEWLVGIGSFAESRAQAVRELLGSSDVRIARVPHPSPANPVANRGWAEAAVAALEEHGVW
jgi:single-strand selective monofunctional uracil DNA glycosylase